MNMVESHTLTTNDIHALLTSSNQWESVDRIVLITFKSICDLLSVQSLKIDKLEKTIDYYSQISQSSIQEISASVDLKVNFSEIQQLLDKKVSKSDLSYLLSNKPNFQDLKNIEHKFAKAEDLHKLYEDLLKRWEDTLSKAELEDIYKLFDTKANKSEVEEALQTKANKQAVASALHKKVNKGELENLINTKADMKELQLISAAIEAKVEYTSFENMKKEFNQKFEEIETWKESLTILPQREEFDELSSEIDRLQQTMFDEIEKGKAISKNQIDKTRESIEIMQKDLFLKFSSENEEKFNSELFSYKTLMRQKIESLDSEILKSSKQVEKVTKYFEVDFKLAKDSIATFHNTVKDITRESQKLISANNSILSDISSLQQELLKIQRLYEEITKKKTTIAQVQEMTELAKEECILSTRQEIHQALISFKSALSEDTNSIREEMQQSLSKYDLNISSILEKKANLNEISNILPEMNNIKRILSTLASQDEVDLIRDSLENMQIAFKKKGDSDTTDKKKLFDCVDNIFKELDQKTSTVELEERLEFKADIEEINKSIGEMYSHIEKKLSLEEFGVHVSGQNIINEALCGENRVARWIWKSGDLSLGNIVWDLQAVNTSQDIFVWDKGKVTIQVLQPGLYQIEFGFFCKKKPNIGVVVNGETVIIGGNGISAKPWGKQIISGLTLVDFLVLSNRSRVCISYSGDPAEGFFGIKKL